MYVCVTLISTNFMMRIDEYFEIVKFSFYGPLAPSIGVSGPSLNSLEKCMISLIKIIQVVLKKLPELHLNGKYYLLVSIWGELTILRSYPGVLDIRGHSTLVCI